MAPVENRNPFFPRPDRPLRPDTIAVALMLTLAIVAGIAGLVGQLIRWAI